MDPALYWTVVSVFIVNFELMGVQRHAVTVHDGATMLTLHRFALSLDGSNGESFCLDVFS